jgi:predicted nucleic acid-binding protein
VARSRRRVRSSASVSDLLVLDAEGVSKAAVSDRGVQAWLERARELDADVIVSAVTLAEVVRGVARDAGVNRVVKAADVWAADEPLARQAGRLLGKAGSDATIDAFVAATAVAGRERQAAARCVVLTSDPEDLRTLLADERGVGVFAV